MELILEAISKTYPGGKRALAELNAKIGPGVTGLIGPNGSGKSTLMRIIATTSLPTSGRLLWHGADAARQPKGLRRDLAYMPQNFGCYSRLSARQYLEYLARLRGTAAHIAREGARSALEAVGLSAERDRRLETFTPGMLKRLGLAYILQTPADVTVLDEPTAGLDPAARETLTAALAARGRDAIVIICTHIASDLETLADRVLALREGRLVIHSSREQVIAEAQGFVWELQMERTSPVPIGRVTARIASETGYRVRVVSEERPNSEALSVTPNFEDACAWLETATALRR